MNVWTWVNELARELRRSGFGLTADEIDQLPGAVFDEDHARVDALAASLIGFAESHDRPWLAAFARHWQLQSRILFRNEGGTVLTAAIDALERAHRPESARCPQTVCTTQDVSLSYGQLDGPGWAAERLAVVDETMARIDPTWDCYSCLMIERCSALLDLHDRDAVADTLERWVADLRVAGRRLSPESTVRRASHLRSIGKPDEALEVLGNIPLHHPRPLLRHEAAIVRLLCLLDLDRGWDDGVDILRLGEFSSNRWIWTELLERAADRGLIPNDLGLARTLRDLRDQLVSNESNRRAYDVSRRMTRLACGRGARWAAEQALADAVRCSERLRFPDREAGEIEALRQRVQGVPARECPWPSHGLIAALDAAASAGEPIDPELQVEWLAAAVAERPDDQGLLERWAVVAAAAAGARVAAHELSLRLAADPSNETLAQALLAALMTGNGSADEFDSLATLIADAQPTLSLWSRALCAERTKDYDAAIAHCRSIVELEPGAVNTRRLWAHAAAEVGDFCEATRVGGELGELLAERGEDRSRDDWTLLIHATRAQEWDVVRTAGARLGMTFDSTTGPVDEAWSWMRIRPRGGGHSGADDLVAVRTGPVTARIRSVIEPHRGRQRFADLVVFDPIPLAPTPSDDEDAGNWRLECAEISILEQGGMSGWTLFGVHPGDEAWEAFLDAIASRRWGLSVLSGPDAWIAHDDEPSEPLRGIYAVLAAPAALAAAEVEAFLADATAAWSMFAWPDLAEAAGVDATRHLDIWDHYTFV